MNTFRRIMLVLLTGSLASAVDASPKKIDIEECQTLYAKGNYRQAVAPCTKAAVKGNGEAQLKLGEMHQSGQGITQDFEQAFKWYNLADKQGYSNPGSIYFLEKMYYHGKEPAEPTTARVADSCFDPEGKNTLCELFGVDKCPAACSVAIPPAPECYSPDGSNGLCARASSSNVCGVITGCSWGIPTNVNSSNICYGDEPLYSTI